MEAVKGICIETKKLNDRWICYLYPIYSSILINDFDRAFTNINNDIVMYYLQMSGPHGLHQLLIAWLVINIARFMTRRRSSHVIHNSRMHA